MFSHATKGVKSGAVGLLLAIAAGLGAAPAPAEPDLRLATTTSTDNSGLLGVLLPKFEAKSGIKVRVIAVGTGKALKLGENGDVDVVLVHSRPDEDRFVAAGFGVNRRDVMYNDFVIVGPAADPAGIRGMQDALGAFRRIAQTGAAFVSRGDDSGTHKLELACWRALGIRPETNPGYRSAGRGMGEVLLMAAELNAYTLTDRATQRALAKKTGLTILVGGDPRLFNPYGIIAVNPQRHADVNFRGAMALVDWITSPEGQQAIADFKVDGEQLFFPDAQK
ncbi:MAG TPA: substrate-binding domain-containing protein [Burkholderiales bacterium]|nr:substrate-binding domain-containing protein [Burkholderiales bacterium]